MLRLTILFAFLTTSVWGQSAIDYELYSQAIQKHEGTDGAPAIEIVIISKLLPTKNQISFGEKFNSANTEEDSITNIEAVKNCIAKLAKEFYEAPTLKPGGFHINGTVKTITSSEFDRYFESKSEDRISKGWKKFYRKHPKAHGVYEFSKIVYTGIYGCFYAGYHCDSTCGEGQLVIARKTDGIWKIIISKRLWVS